MNNKVLIVVLSLLVIILSGACLMFFVGNTVSVSVGPLTATLGESVAIQKEIRNNLKTRGNVDLNKQLQQINQRLSVIETKLNGTKAIPSKNVGGGGGCGGAQVAPDANKVYDIPVGTTPVLGKKNASITIVMFSDFQCPFCNRFYPAVRDVVKAYPDKVKLMIKNYPLAFHSKAAPAAKLALAANLQGKYFEMVQILKENGADVSDEKIKEYAQKLALNYQKLMDDYKNKDAQWQKILDDDKALAEKVAINGTPTFYINGKKTSARDLESYKAEIDAILSTQKK